MGREGRLKPGARTVAAQQRRDNQRYQMNRLLIPVFDQDGASLGCSVDLSCARSLRLDSAD